MQILSKRLATLVNGTSDGLQYVDSDLMEVYSATDPDQISLLRPVGAVTTIRRVDSNYFSPQKLDGLLNHGMRNMAVIKSTSGVRKNLSSVTR